MFAVLGLGEAAARLIGFAGTVYVARRLGADSYGIIAVAAAIVLYFSHVADFSVEVLGARTLAREPGSVDHIAAPLLVARLWLALGCIVVLCVAGLFFLPQPDGAILAVTSLTLLGIAGSTRFVFLGIERPAAAAVGRVVAELLALALIVVLVRDPGDMSLVPWAHVVGDGTMVVILALVLKRFGYSLRLRRAPEVVRPLFLSAWPLVAHAVLGLAIFNSDLIFLRALKDARTAGMYAAAYTLISFLLNIGVTYGNSLLPVLAREGSDDADPARQRTLFDHAMIQVIAVALPLSAGGCLLADGLMHLVFGAKYVAAVPALQVLIWSIVVAWVRNVVQMGLIARHQQAFVLRTSVWSAAANFVLNVLLIPRYGMIGAAVATVATETIRTVVALVYSGRLGLPFGVTSRLWRPVLGTVAMAVALWLIPLPSVLVAVPVGVIAYAIVLVGTGGVRFVAGRPTVHL
ncbi:MAG: flippase [bacterium]